MNIILIIILMTILLILAWAIFSSKTEIAVENKAAAEKEQQIDEPEKILRRRSADRAIEKEFPAEKISAESEAYDREDIAGQIQLPFPANDIIADGSRFKLYKRALINSEIYAKRGDIETAVSLFKGVKERILDSDIRSKIESNINYLNHFRHRRDEDFKKKVDSAYSGQPSGELRLRIDGPVPQTINIGMPEKSFINTDEIIGKLSEQISKELGTLKNDIERLKSKPEDKFDLDDYAEFSNLQHEFNNLKERFEELTEERLNTLKELNKLRELKEEELEKEKIKDHSPENHELLKDIRKEIDNLELLDKINQKKKKKKAEALIPAEEVKEKITPPEEDEAIDEIEAEDLTYEELDAIQEEAAPVTEETEHAEELFPADEIPVIEEEHDVSAEDLTTLEAEELLNEISPEDEESISYDEEALFEAPEHEYEEPVPDETPLKEEDLASELSDDEIESFSKDGEPESEFIEPVREVEETPSDDEAKDELTADEILKTEKEKEIEKHIDAEENPNDFDLLSDMGKTNDDSTLTDEDIFEKILKDEKNKNDDSSFEIIGDNAKDDQEFTLNDSILDGKKKAEQDFYKKFIKADRIKKRELPILKVSYDFKKLPDEFSLSREKNILEYSFYKYKPMLQKADEYIKHRHVRDAINYYKVVLDQNIPIEFKAMIRRNIRDLTEYLEKYLSSE
jgi:hypothetical protein